MLVLSRRNQEAIRIGDDVCVVVLGIIGNVVKLGIDAPQNVAVHRQEIYDAIQRQKEGDDA